MHTCLQLATPLARVRSVSTYIIIERSVINGFEQDELFVLITTQADPRGNIVTCTL